MICYNDVLSLLEFSVITIHVRQYFKTCLPYKRRLHIS